MTESQINQQSLVDAKVTSTIYKILGSKLDGFHVLRIIPETVNDSLRVNIILTHDKMVEGITAKVIYLFATNDVFGPYWETESIIRMMKMLKPKTFDRMLEQVKLKKYSTNPYNKKGK